MKKLILAQQIKKTEQWINYAKLSGFYKEIKEKYPKPFKLYENSLTKL
jgi:hypothetical protein